MPSRAQARVAGDSGCFKGRAGVERKNAARHGPLVAHFADWIRIIQKAEQFRETPREYPV